MPTPPIPGDQPLHPEALRGGRAAETETKAELLLWSPGALREKGWGFG